MRRLLFALLAVLVLASCSGAGAPTSLGGGSGGELAVTDAKGVPGRNVAGPAGPLGAAVPAGMPAPVAQQQSVPVPLAFEADRYLILTANVALQAKEPWVSADRVQAIATTLGGDVIGLSQSGSGDQKRANLTVRVPSARFNDALRQIRDLTDIEVVSSGVDGKDVTEQFVDLEARLKVKQAEEVRYQALLARANTIDEILKIDQVLSSVRTQIEQLTGQLNSIRQRTQFSTITVSIAPLLGIVPPKTDGAYDPSKTVERALAALVAVLRVGVDVAIWLLVFAWVPLVAFGLLVAMQRSRRTVTPTSTSS